MRKLAAALGVALACLAAAAHAQNYSPAAKQVLARAQAASGGRGWLYLRGVHETGKLGTTPYQSWTDTLRYGVRIETREAAGLRIHAYNGAGDWQILPNGKPTGADDRPALARARTAAFLSAYGYFFPSRFPADGAHIGVRQADGRSFDVLRVKPGGGEPRELWFDRADHLLARIVDRTGAAPVTTEVSDYRKIGPVLIAFRAATDRGGAVQDRKVDSVTFTPADRELFSWTPTSAAAAVQPVQRAVRPPSTTR